MLKLRVEHTGPDGGPIQHALQEMPDLRTVSDADLAHMYREAIAAPKKPAQ